jgi:hypothetical protein
VDLEPIGRKVHKHHTIHHVKNFLTRISILRFFFIQDRSRTNLSTRIQSSMSDAMVGTSPGNHQTQEQKKGNRASKSTIQESRKPWLRARKPWEESGVGKETIASYSQSLPRSQENLSIHLLLSVRFTTWCHFYSYNSQLMYN